MGVCGLSKNERLFEDDPFWDIDALMPKAAKRKNRGAAPGRKEDDKERTAPAGSFAAPARERQTPLQEEREVRNGTPLPAFDPTPERSFCIEDGRLIRRVDVYAWPNKYSFFEGFRRNALAVLHMRAREVPFEPFFSFMPQFHQLTAAQLRYYLYWRESFLRAVYLRTDYCYLLLYICEILNLPDAIPPSEGANLLCRLWAAYRKAFPKLDKYLSEWLCDYCLMHGVRPSDRLFDMISDAGRAASTFKEFYMTREQCAHPGRLLSTYSYKNSKYRTPENAALFDLHIPAALALFYDALARRENAGEDRSLVQITRTSYDGAVCVYSEKKRIDVFYTPARALGTPMLATDAEKLCENYVRSALGIRARMPAPSLYSGLRSVIEDYFARNLPSASTAKKTEELRINDRYEPEKQGLSAAEAKKIERSSLDVAVRLGQIYEEDPALAAAAAPSGEEHKENGKTEQEDKQVDFMLQHKSALKALLEGGSRAFSAYAASIGVMPHTLADEINEEAIERIGDIVLVGDDEGFEILQDYESEVEEWINS